MAHVARTGVLPFDTCSTPRSTKGLRRVKIRVTMTVYSYAKPRERIDAAVQRIALAAEIAVNHTGELRADVKHYRQQEPE